MKTTAATQSPTGARRPPSHPSYLNESLSPKKTAFVIVTVIGCIAILWPKVFYPMMFGGSPPKVDVKEQRVPGGCCDVVLDREQFLNSSSATEIGPMLYRKHLNFITNEISLRQERPTHLHPESIYQAMRERGRAIPATPTVPIIDRKASPSNPPPRIVEGRPGPIPGMRPPMGAGSVHQPQTKGSSMGFVMPLYTIGIVVFFVYTILKIVFKKSTPNAPYGPAPVNANFRKEVFGEDTGRPHDDLTSSKLGSNLQHPMSRKDSDLYSASLSAASAATNLSSSLKQNQPHHRQQQQQQPPPPHLSTANNTAATALGKLFSRETEQLMEIEKLRKKLEDTEKAMARLIAEMNSDQYDAKMIIQQFLKRQSQI